MLGIKKEMAKNDHHMASNKYVVHNCSKLQTLAASLYDGTRLDSVLSNQGCKKGEGVEIWFGGSLRKNGKTVISIQVAEMEVFFSRFSTSD